MIRKRGKIWWVRYYKDGRPYDESSGSTKEGGAKRLLRLREGAVEQGLPITPRAGWVRFDEAAKDLIIEYRTNGRKSLDELERRIDLHLAPCFGRRRMASITTADVRRFIDERQRSEIVPRTPRSIVS
jgi:hypothetical protein